MRAADARSFTVGFFVGRAFQSRRFKQWAAQNAMAVYRLALELAKAALRRRRQV
jgi:hypothetical protein